MGIIDRIKAAVSGRTDNTPCSGGADIGLTDMAKYGAAGKEFGLCLGESTGVLSRRGDPNGIYGGQLVYLGKRDVCQNTVIFGGIGAGKTTRMIQPLLQQVLLYPDIGGLIFDVKSDFKYATDLYACLAGRQVYHIGTGEGTQGVNLIAGLRPEQVSSYLMSAMRLIQGGGGGNNAFFYNSAIELVRNVLGILSFADQAQPDKGFYTLGRAYEYIYKPGARDAIRNVVENIDFPDFSDDELRLMAYQSYITDVYDKMPPETRQSVNATLAPILQPFTDPELDRAFSTGTDSYDLQGILGGDIVLVDMPLSRWGAGGKVVYTLIKLRFFNLLQTRQYDRSLPQNLCMFLCDEYQELISASGGAAGGLDDRTFWDKSRSSGCFGIISSQSVEAFQSVIGDQQITAAILANFRQKITFRTESQLTTKLFSDIAGKVKILQTTSSFGGGGSSNLMKLSGDTQNYNYNNQTQIVDQEVIDAQVIHQLDQDHALAMLNIDGSAADDVLFVPAYFDDGGGNTFFITTVLPAVNPAYTANRKALEEGGKP